MMEEGNQKYRRGFWIALGAFTLFRLILAGQFGLGVDESHYALYARNFAWGYFDHPPMVGLLGAATTLFGENPFLLRLGPIIGWSVSVILLRGLALALYGSERIAFWSLVLLLLMPVQHLLAMALLPDATLNPFWCACLLTAWYALRDGTWRMWILTGVTVGLAVLSKYHGVLIPMCLLGFVVSSRRHWRWFRSPKPYVAALVALVVFLPNIIWNYQNDWISYKFQMGHGGGSGYFSLGKLSESIGGQLGAASPILFVLLVLAWIVLLKDRSRSDADRFAWWTSLPVFAFFCGIGLFGKILPHWPTVGWWSGSVLLVAVVVRKLESGGKMATRWRRWCGIGGLVGGLLVLFLYIAISFPVIKGLYHGARQASIRLHESLPFVQVLDPYEPKIDISNDLYGWDESADLAEAARATMPDPDRTFVFCHRFFTTSQLKVHLASQTVATSLHRKPSQYRIWFVPKDYQGWDAVFVDVDHWPQEPDRYLPLFDRVADEIETHEILRRGKVARRLKVYRYYGFKGKHDGE